MTKEPLFNGSRDVSNEEVIEKMNYFISKAELGMELYQRDRKASLELAKELREELRIEYKNNNLNKIRKQYKDHELFLGFYKWAVHEALVSITGPTSYDKIHSFFYDVKSYMRYYIPREYK